MLTVGLPSRPDTQYLVVPELTVYNSCSAGESARCVAISEHPTETLPATDRSKELQRKTFETTLRVFIHLTNL
jgi:hypothetical protein